MTTRVKVLFHNRCFDGVTSAALFTRFYRERVDAGAEFRYLGLAHQKGNPFPPGSFDADQHCCVDFRYSPDPKLTWWFDHHQSAFVTKEEEAHFRADTSGQKFFDPTARSCSKFLADTTAERFGFDRSGLEDLIAWADVIDSASFKNAEEAVALEAPALKIMTAVENAENDAFIEQIIRQITERPLAELAAAPEVRAVFEPVLERHRKAIGLVQERAQLEGDVVYLDLADQGVEGFNKFIPYALFPSCRYVVTLTAAPQRAKVSVGSNPWPLRPRTHNIASICERYGGGGHPVVGAISLGAGEGERARQIAREVVEELKVG